MSWRPLHPEKVSIDDLRSRYELAPEPAGKLHSIGGASVRWMSLAGTSRTEIRSRFHASQASSCAVSGLNARKDACLLSVALARTVRFKSRNALNLGSNRLRQPERRYFDEAIR